jgi:Family of unknown function (DUF5565)
VKKIPTLFLRGPDMKITDEVSPACLWVAKGEGTATQKLDGTCCLVRDGNLLKRYTLRRGKAAPEFFEPVTEADPVTGKQEGWVPVGDGPEDKFHREAWAETLADGTYELIGPKVQGNPEHRTRHVLERHGDIVLDPDPPRTFAGLREWLACHDVEGIVWHHPDGRMAKIKGRDFGKSRKHRATAIAPEYREHEQKETD